MLVTDEHIQLLRDIHSFAKIKRYHGLLPVKHLLFHDQDVVEELKSDNLIEKRAIYAQCGGKMTGYRLTKAAAKRLKKLGHKLEEDDLEDRLMELSGVDPEELSPRHIEILSDVYHFSKVKVFGGLIPKHEMKDHYDKKDIRLLYDLGLILYIKIKGSDVKYEKGYILSELGRSVLRQLGLVQEG
jgi:hypothetical protein